MTYFWLDTRDELDATRADFTAQVENLEGTIAQRDGQITDLQTQLDTARDDLQDLQTQLEGSQNEVEFLEEANEAISLCLDLIRSEEHTSELQSRENLVCRLLLEKKKTRRCRAR